MRRQEFNHGWQFHKKGCANAQSVTLPHNAMIRGRRAADSPSGSAGAFFPGGEYVTFTVPAQWAEKALLSQPLSILNSFLPPEKKDELAALIAGLNQ